MASAENGVRRNVAAPVTRGAPLPRPLLPADQRAAQPSPWVDPLDVTIGTVSSPPHDHHVRLTERHCAGLLRAVGWVFVAGGPGRAPSLIRPRRLDHLGGC
jgi:hypothetical protein